MQAIPLARLRLVWYLYDRHLNLITLRASVNTGPSVHSAREEKGRKLVDLLDVHVLLVSSRTRLTVPRTVKRRPAVLLMDHRSVMSSRLLAFTSEQVHTALLERRRRENIVPTYYNTHGCEARLLSLDEPSYPLPYQAFPSSRPFLIFGVLSKASNARLISGSG